MGKVNNLQTILKSTVSNFPKQKISSQLLQHTQLMAPQVCIFEICPYYVHITKKCPTAIWRLGPTNQASIIKNKIK